MLTQYGVLAYQLDIEGEPRFLLITSRQSRRWVIPRGNPISGLLPWQAAAQEAYEEAGLSGLTGSEALGSYGYRKQRGGRSLPARVHVFPMLVTGQSHLFPERHQRETRWFSREEAAQAVDEAELQALILGFSPAAGPGAAAGYREYRPRSPAVAAVSGWAPVAGWINIGLALAASQLGGTGRIGAYLLAALTLVIAGLASWRNLRTFSLASCDRDLLILAGAAALVAILLGPLTAPGLLSLATAGASVAAMQLARPPAP